MPVLAQKLPNKETSNRTPLCVDLDGTIIATDLLHESLFALLRQNFLFIFVIPFWLWKGKAVLKEQIAQRAKIDPEGLPYRTDVLDFLRAEKEKGRWIVLATASHWELAQPIAEHLDLFDEIMASVGSTNLKGEEKLKALQQRFGATGFDYIGDSRADLIIWEHSQSAWLVQPSARLARKAESVCVPKRVFKSKNNNLKAAFKLVRPHQWVKNLLLFVPLILAHQFTNWTAIGSSLLAFVAFSLCASAVYVLNDLLDIQADRSHPKKKRRPLAAGKLSIPQAISIFATLLVAGLVIPVLLLPIEFSALLLVYMVATTAYSFYLKRQPLVDVFLLAGLYTLRILAGGAAASVPVSGWLIAFSVFFFISLALVKRYSELARAATEKNVKLDHRGYWTEDLGMIQSIGPASGYMAVLTMCLYINNPDVLLLYSSPQVLWVICFVLFYWLTRVWFLARRRQLNEDPVVFATCDPVSYVSGAVVLGALLYAAA